MADFHNKLWVWCVFPSLSMGLGWMLRGYIGGGFLGAMIPGALVGLALCLLLGRQRDAGFIAAMAAVGVGFGGQETYGQTVGLALKPESFYWAILGFFLKGGVWGFLGGAILGLGFSRDRFTRKDFIVGFGLMVAGTYLGWKVVNQPKLIYFSDRINKPREELWFGLLVGALCLLVYLSYRAGAQVAWRFALWGLVGGGVGFASGAAVQVWGRNNAADFPLGWWKVMELVFGLLLGLGFGLSGWRNRKQIDATVAVGSNVGLITSMALAVLAICVTLPIEPKLPSRMGYTIVGAILLVIALYSEEFCWHLGITVTYFAFALDLVKARPSYSVTVMWVVVLVTTLAVAGFVFRASSPLSMFLLITWTSTGMGLLKSFLPPAKLDKSGAMEGLFVVLAGVTSILAWRLSVKKPTAQTRVPQDRR